jgi:hypothetical protein
MRVRLDPTLKLLDVAVTNHEVDVSPADEKLSKDRMAKAKLPPTRITEETRPQELKLMIDVERRARRREPGENPPDLRARTENAKRVLRSRRLSVLYYCRFVDRNHRIAGREKCLDRLACLLRRGDRLDVDQKNARTGINVGEELRIESLPALPAGDAKSGEKVSGEVLLDLVLPRPIDALRRDDEEIVDLAGEFEPTEVIEEDLGLSRPHGHQERVLGASGHLPERLDLIVARRELRLVSH